LVRNTAEDANARLSMELKERFKKLEPLMADFEKIGRGWEFRVLGSSRLS
jgi:hypothetical protein